MLYVQCYVRSATYVWQPYVPVLYMEEYKGVKIEQTARKLGFRVPKPSFLLFNSISQVLSISSLLRGRASRVVDDVILELPYVYS